MDLLDSYVLRARLFPAILAVSPAIAFLLANVAVSLDRLGPPQVLVSVAVAILFFAFSDLARRFGRRIEKTMFASTGGRPFPTVLRHSDGVIDPKSKDRYVAFLSKQLGERAPSKTVEENNPEKADAFYILAGNWLRENTRDTTKFQLLFAENIVYGFRRNLLGLKWVGLGLNLVTVCLCTWLLWLANWVTFPQYGAVLMIAGLHALYFLFGVSPKSVKEASNQYSRQLVLSSETLMRDEQVKSATKAAN